jgi:FKBP-type peptidyl-prolyl cis-trans isomerase SlyD
MYEQDPAIYLHGHGNIFAALETALEGKVTGDNISITLKPEEAYGYRNELPTQRVPIKHLVPNRKSRRRDVFQLETDRGHQNVVILKVGKFNIDVDFNHPLAGKTLRFEIEVGNIRNATQDELDHGHAR